MDRKQAKKMLKMAVLIYVASFLIINWNDISWIFNYKEVYGLVSDFFNPYPTIDVSSVSPYFYPNHSSESGQNLQTAKVSFTEKQSAIEIPKISILAPIIFSTSANKTALMDDLNKGVVYYPGSVYPGQVGQIVILGHSAPAGWPKIKYDWVFTELDKLAVGDKVMIDLSNKQYTYTVKNTEIIKRGEEVPTTNLTGTNNVLTLISCWPPGKDYQRIAVQATLDTN